MSGLRKYWQGLESRERLLLTVGGGLVFLILFYSLVWEPWHHRIKTLRVEVPSRYADLVWLTWQKDHLKGLKTRSAARKLTKPTAVLTFIEQSAHRHGVRQSLTISPGRGQQTRIVIKSALFGQALGFVQDLNKAGFELVSVLLKGTEQPGRVDLTLTVAG